MNCKGTFTFEIPDPLIIEHIDCCLSISGSSKCANGWTGLKNSLQGFSWVLMSAFLQASGAPNPDDLQHTCSICPTRQPSPHIHIHSHTHTYTRNQVRPRCSQALFWLSFFPLFSATSGR